MSPLHAASGTAATAAGLGGSLLTWLVHQESSADAVPLAVAFGVLSALIAHVLVLSVVKRRVGRAKPVLGALRGAFLGVATFVIAVTIHTAFFPGRTGFPASLVPVLLVGLALFGWGVAIVGACVGAFCERRHFRDASARASPATTASHIQTGTGELD
jgi:Na+(H+)/acetate symporter ActP